MATVDRRKINEDSDRADRIYDSTLARKRREGMDRNNRVNKQSNERPVQIKVGNVDYVISTVVTLLVLIGIVMVFSASYYICSTSKEYNYDAYALLKKQALVAVLGFVAMYFMSNFYYAFLRKFAFLIYSAAAILLVAVQFYSVAVKGAKRWITIPIINISLQPSEVAKVGVILLVSFVISNNKDILKTWKGFFACSAIVVVSAALVAWGNLSTSIIIMVIGMGIIFIASPYTTRFVVLGSIFASAVGLFITFAQGFRSDRVAAWLDPFSKPRGIGYQIIQSLYAVASGGLFGLGLGQSRQKMGFLPEAHNDIIFSIICEELGFMFAAFVLFLFAVLIWRGITVALNAVDLFATLVASGIVILIAIQVIINVAVVTNSMPNTGVPLPFISYGGTSLAITMFLMGILLNISRYSKE